MRQVHLVGSIGLDTVGEVFEICGGLLGPYLKRLPDGEPGGRRLWISWQFAVLRANPYLQPDIATHRSGGIGFHPIKLADGVAPEEVRFGELGYAREARASYLDFLAARARGLVPRNLRFQVSLPTPFAVVGPFCTPDARAAILRAYEAAMLREVDALCAAIPQHDLAIQWDVCIEMVMWDGGSPTMAAFTGMEQVFAQSFARLGAAVAPEVDLGFHLCYGDLDAIHFVQPRDAAKMVEFAHLLMRSVTRPIQWLHMPVPIERTDDAFYAPLRDFALPMGCELYLGLVHARDGVEGTRRRIAVAQCHAPDFGIATECGIARARRPELVRQLLEIHAGVAAAA